jgi:hypothetical protein
MQTKRIEPMRYHGPGWTLDLSDRDEDGEVVADGEHYWVWAPQGEGAQRQHWAACWQSGDGEAGDFIKGKSAADVLYIFPDRIARRFRAHPDIR